MRHSKTDQQPDIRVELAEGIPADAADYAEGKLLHLTKYAHRPILSARVRLVLAGHGNHRDVVAHASLDVSGTPVIAHTNGKTTSETVDLLQDKLRGLLTSM